MTSKELVRYISYLIVLVIAVGIGYVISEAYVGRTPAQPIEFSHVIHAGEHEVPCMYCHIFAERSRVSGVPNVQRCIGCHKIIKTDSPEIIKLTEYWNTEEPIPWIKVHNLPDHVYFPHKRHIRAGLDCSECHGDVASMKRVTRVSSLKMGWCLKCHTKKQVKNGRDCWTCHQ